MLATAALAAALLLVAVYTEGSSISMVAGIFGLAACGSSAAYALDEFAVAVADASPTSRTRRLAWRMLTVVTPALVASVGLLALDRANPSMHWLRLAPFAAGALALGVCLAAALRRRGWSTPGDLAGMLAFSTIVITVVVDPLHRWVAIAPLGNAAHPDRSILLWVVAAAACLAITFICARDPGRQAAHRQSQRR
jgi:hypothetical protein